MRTVKRWEPPPNLDEACRRCKALYAENPPCVTCRFYPNCSKRDRCLHNIVREVRNRR